MTMHPELEYAFDSGVPMREIIKIFKKHHGGPMETELDYRDFLYPDASEDPKDCEYYDAWMPLQRALPLPTLHPPDSVSEPLLNIHKALTRDVISWICDSERKSNICFITEREFRSRLFVFETPIYTRAAALASICYGAQRLGLFQDYSDTTISEMSIALAAFHPTHRRNLTQILIDNPGIDDLPTRTQFRKLIHEPWKALQVSHPQYIATPPVIILRWEYECDDEDLLRSICEFGSHCSSLLWIVSINPKFNLPILDLLEPLAPFPCIRTSVCYDEASADASLVLHHRFGALRDKHEEVFDEEVFDEEMWPSEKQMSQLVRVVSGVVEFVDVIIQFVDWEADGGPRAHLETALAYMVDSPSPSDEQPYCALDHFYIRALSDIPSDILLVVKKAFSIICCTSYNPTLPGLLCLLSLENDTFFPYMKRLAVRTYNWEFQEPCSYFRDFLRDPNASGQFYTSELESLLHTAHAYLHAVAHCSNLTSIMKHHTIQYGQMDQHTYSDRILHKLRIYAGCNLCSLASKVYDPSVEWKSLLRFDFRCLAHTSDYIWTDSFMRFLIFQYRLYEPNSVNIVRVQPASSLDRKFIEKCEGVVEPLALEEEVEKDEWPITVPKYVLLGYGAETVLVVLFVKYYKMTIYTSAMLDYM